MSRGNVLTLAWRLLPRRVIARPAPSSTTLTVSLTLRYPTPPVGTHFPSVGIPSARAFIEELPRSLPAPAVRPPGVAAERVTPAARARSLAGNRPSQGRA